MTRNGMEGQKLWLLVAIIGLFSIVKADLQLNILENPQYSVQIGHGRWIKRSQVTEASNVMLLTAPDGKRLSCTLPMEGTESKEDDKQPPDPKDAANEVAELLEPLRGHCMHRIAGWWIYEFCHGQHIVQYHEDNNDPKTRVEYNLGYPNPEQRIGVIDVTPDDRHVYIEQYAKGTTCDLTNLPRKTDVKFVCNALAAEHIADIKEVSTCNYEIVINTPRICQHPLFTPATAVPARIECLEIVPDEEAEKRLEDSRRQLHTPQPSGAHLDSALAQQLLAHQETKGNADVETLRRIAETVAKQMKNIIEPQPAAAAKEKQPVAAPAPAPLPSFVQVTRAQLKSLLAQLEDEEDGTAVLLQVEVPGAETTASATNEAQAEKNAEESNGATEQPKETASDKQPPTDDQQTKDSAEQRNDAPPSEKHPKDEL